MPRYEHSTVREGVIAGLIGGGATALALFVVDLLAGRPFYTPSVLGQVFFGIGSPAGHSVIPAAVAGYTVVHFALFILGSIGTAWLVHASIREPAWRFGTLLFFFSVFPLFPAILLVLVWRTGQDLPWWSLMLGGLVATVALGLYFWRGHDALRRSFAETPLGDEPEGPPAPPRLRRP